MPSLEQIPGQIPRGHSRFLADLERAPCSLNREGPQCSLGVQVGLWYSCQESFDGSAALLFARW